MNIATDLVYLKKLLMNMQAHYKNPHSEAMKLRVLWTYDKDYSKESEMDMSKNYLKEANKLTGILNEPSEKILAILKKGLHMNPRSHELYALRGEIYVRKRDWRNAIKWYETAKRMLKFDKTMDGEKMIEYREKLRNVYYARGNWHDENERLIEAVADYEQVLVLNPQRDQIFQVQDKLLRCLRKLDKYEAYRLAWSEFAKAANPQRAADLIAQHAEFKIHLREVATARRMLREAVSLDKRNANAQDLLQVIFDTGHTMLVYSIIWCMTGCYDKALMTIDKGTDCDPYNPGFTVLKTIVLRLSGRLIEAMEWLETVDKTFYKLLEPSFNERGSIMGNLTVEQTKAMLTDQWYLIRYDMAVERMINGKYETALKILQNEKLLKKFVEPWLLMGDCLLHQGRVEQALKAYLHAHGQSIATGCWRTSVKKNLLVQRITEILNSQSRPALQIKETQKARKKAEGSLRVLNEQKITSTNLGSQRGEALMHVARSHFQVSPMLPTSPCLKALADSLSFARGVDDGGIRDAVLGGNIDLEKAIECFASKKKFPYCTKILMQN